MTSPLRSRIWFGPKTLDGLMKRGDLKAEGFDHVLQADDVDLRRGRRAVVDAEAARASRR